MAEDLVHRPRPRFLQPRLGTATGDYEGACKSLGFKLWAGANAKKGTRAQPPDIADVLLHETAISWIRYRLGQSATDVRQRWLESPREFAVRMAKDVAYVNRVYDVAGLAREFPRRLKDLVEASGDRLKK